MDRKVETGTKALFDYKEKWAIEFTRANALEAELRALKASLGVDGSDIDRMVEDRVRAR